MELRQLRSFLVLARELHFRRTALRVGITQPALSQQIAALEAELGVSLFERSRRRVDLTETGARFAERLRTALGALQDAVDEAKRSGDAAHQRLRVGYLEYVNLPFLGPLLRTLAARHPEIVVERRNMWSAEVLEALGERALDVGFAFMPITQPALAFRPVLEGYWTAILPEDHPLAGHASVSLEALAKEPLILFDRSVNPPLYDWMVGRFDAAGLSPRIVYATTQVAVGLDLVAQGVGCFLLASYVVQRPPEGTVVRPIEGLDVSLRLAAVWRADDRSAATRNFLEVLRGVTKALPRGSAGAGRHQARRHSNGS